MTAVVLAAVHSLFAAAVRSSDAVWAAEQERAAVGTLAEMMSRDLAGVCAAVPGEAPLSLDSGAQFGMGAAELSFLTASPDFRPGAEQEPAVSRVSYVLSPATGRPGRYALVRLERPFFAPETERPRSTFLTGDVTQFEVSVFDGAEWTGHWPRDEQETGLPAGVRIRLGLGADGPAQRASVLRAFDTAQLPRRGEE